MSTPRSFVAAPSEGAVFTIGPFRIVSRVQGGQSNQLFELYDLTLTPSTIDYHVHETMDETLTVLEGEIEFIVEGKKFLRPVGSVAFVPRGLQHGFTNHGPATARVLILFTPSGAQHEYFKALEQLFAVSPLDTAAVAALQKRYDQALVPLPS